MDIVCLKNININTLHTDDDDDDDKSCVVGVLKYYLLTELPLLIEVHARKRRANMREHVRSNEIQICFYSSLVLCITQWH